MFRYFPKFAEAVQVRGNTLGEMGCTGLANCISCSISNKAISMRKHQEKQGKTEHEFQYHAKSI